MKKRVVVLDFDGTVTDAEEEGKPFVTGYLNDMRLLLDKSLDDMSLIVQSAETEIAANPKDNGWVYDGVVVAPATVDPYLRIQAVARLVFDRFGRFLNHKDRQSLLQLLFAHNYSLSGTVFKDGAAQLLHDVGSNKEVVGYIVTNSSTEAVCKKMARLGELYPKLARPGIQVIGGAKKYVVRGQPEHVPGRLAMPGLDRYIYLHRSAYYSILEDIREENNISWEDMAVIGDIFELDLAMPLVLGTKIGLVANQFTPQYERDFITSHPTRATLINSLSEVLPFVLR